MNEAEKTVTKTVVKPSEAAQKLRVELLEVMNRYGDQINSAEIVAMLAYITGQAVAMLDRTKFNSDRAMALVNANIDAGNKSAVDNLVSVKGTKH